LVYRDIKEYKASRMKVVLRDGRDILDYRERKAQQVPKVHLVSRVIPHYLVVKVSRGLRGIKDTRGTKHPKVNRGFRDGRVRVVIVGS
jgi:hypothetical protein